MTARKNGRRINYMLEFATVRYWQGQLNESGIKNSTSNLTDTRTVYLTRLAAFNEWLPGRIFDMRVQAVADGRIVRETAQKSFANVEELRPDPLLFFKPAHPAFQANFCQAARFANHSNL